MRGVKVRGQRFIGSCLRMKKDKNRQGVLFEEVTKMRKRLKKISFGLVAVGLSLTLLLTAAIPVSQAGSDEKVVKVGLAIALSGALANTGQGALALKDYIDYANERHIIPGVRLDLRWIDVGRAPIVDAMTAHKRFVEWGEMIELGYLLDTNEILAPKLPKEEIPFVSVVPYTQHLLNKPVPWTFGGFSSAQDYFSVGVKWFVGNWSEERPAKIGFIGYDQAPVHRGVEGMKALIQDYGPNVAEFVGLEVVPFLGVLDTSVEWLRLANRGADLIMCLACGASEHVLIKDCARLGILEGGTTVIDCGECIEDAVMVTGGSANGWYVVKGFHSALERNVLENVPEMNEVLSTAMKCRDWGGEGLRGLKTHGLYVLGWICASVAIEGIRVAAEKVGPENLSGRAIREGLASIENFDIGLTSPITMSDDKPYYFDEACVYRIEGEEMILVESGIPIRRKWLSTWIKG